jgi:hypothetical protein
VERLVVALALCAVVGVVAVVLRRRRAVDAPTQMRHVAPAQLDRADFPDAIGHEWLLVAFTSASCHTCADMLAKARVVQSRSVAVLDVEFTAARELHRKYAIEAVPMLVLADTDGVVRASFIGRASATDVWAAVARARDPELDTGGGCDRH